MDISRTPTSPPFPRGKGPISPSSRGKTIGNRSNKSIILREGPVKPSRKPQVPDEKYTEEPQIVINAEYIFRNYVSSVIDENTIKKFLTAKYTNSNLIINEDDKDIMIEIIDMINDRSYDFNYILEFINDSKNRESIFWEQKIMNIGKVSIEREIMINRLEEVGYKGKGKCRFCSNDELSYALKQVNSGDEPMKVFVRCIKCGKHWVQ